MMTFSADGYITVRSVSEPDRSFKVLAHDPYQGGVIQSAMERDGRFIYTVSGCGMIRTWEWSYTTMGKKAANEFTAEMDSEMEQRTNVVDTLKAQLKSAATVDYSDVVRFNEPYSSPKLSEEDLLESDREKKEAQAADETFQKSLDAIKNRLSQLMEKNTTANDLEKLPQDAFVLDTAEKQRLEDNANSAVQAIKNELVRRNCRDKVLFERLKAEFWDCMEVVGKSIKSFHPDTLTDSLIEITNYPLCKRTPAEILHVEKVKLRRKIQKSVNQSIKVCRIVCRISCSNVRRTKSRITPTVTCQRSLRWQVRAPSLLLIRTMKLQSSYISRLN